LAPVNNDRPDSTPIVRAGVDPHDQLPQSPVGGNAERRRAGRWPDLPQRRFRASGQSNAHQRGLIHKDVKPENVLVALEPSGDAGRIWLTGFGIASRLPRERQAPGPPEIIAGTLAYMSPEQTGRMNRSTDASSDLYSLGVTLYQMLTGALPFLPRTLWSWSTATSHVNR
jgi:serine/threonine protein kinase